MESDFEKKKRLFFTIVPFVAFLYAGAALWKGHSARALVIGGIGCFLIALNLFLPDAAASLFRAQSALLARVGSFLTKAFMIVFFYVIFCPYGFLMRLFGGDLLHRKWEARDSYWLPKESQPDCRKPY